MLTFPGEIAPLSSASNIMLHAILKRQPVENSKHDNVSPVRKKYLFNRALGFPSSDVH